MKEINWWENVKKVAAIQSVELELTCEMKGIKLYLIITNQNENIHYEYIVDDFDVYDNKTGNEYLESIVEALETCNDLEIIKCFSGHYVHTNDILDFLHESYIISIEELFWSYAQTSLTQLNSKVAEILSPYINYDIFVRDLENEGGWEQLDENCICYIG